VQSYFESRKIPRKGEQKSWNVNHDTR